MELVPKNMGTMDRLIFQRKMDEIPDKIVISDGKHNYTTL